MKLKLYSALSAVQHAVSPDMESIGYWERNALQAMGAQGFRVADYQKDSELLGQIQNIYNVENIKAPPMVVIYKQDVPNAAFIHTGTIVISTGLLKRLDKDEREAVLAHEVTHQQQNKVNLSVFGGYLLATLAATTVLTKKFMKAIPQKFNNTLINYASFGLIGTATNFVTSVPFFAHKRHQEYKADEGAVRITGKPEKLISALRKLEKYPEERQSQNNGKDEIPATDLAISSAAINSNAVGDGNGWRSSIKKLHATHPSVDSRVERLEAMRAQQAAGVNSTNQR